jgi:hypothetical protein
MGLDNGFYVKSKKRKITREMLPSIIKYPFDKDYNDNVEIVYWRKNWGLRYGVLDILDKRFEDEYKYEIDKPSTVHQIIVLIAAFLDPERWRMKVSQFGVLMKYEIRSFKISLILRQLKCL